LHIVGNWRWRRGEHDITGGAIGCELAQSFARLGSEVTLVEMGDRLLSREDKEASDLLVSSMKLDGVDLRLGYRATVFEQ
jgi:pyruvate/2-oxoglutarate dehydrogenase complex dihydrolipoamide dehydrogenase (E3) component